MIKIAQSGVQLCRVYTPPPKKIGTWILVDKLWPRGLKTDALDFDLWLKELAPSTPLRKWFHQDPDNRWQEFKKSYIDELKNQSPLLEEISDLAAQQVVTLFYAAKDEQHNHALVLQAMLIKLQ